MSTPQKKKKPSKTKDAEPVLTTHVEETVKEFSSSKQVTLNNPNESIKNTTKSS